MTPHRIMQLSNALEAMVLAHVLNTTNVLAHDRLFSEIAMAQLRAIPGGITSTSGPNAEVEVNGQFAGNPIALPCLSGSQEEGLLRAILNV